MLGRAAIWTRCDPTPIDNIAAGVAAISLFPSFGTGAIDLGFLRGYAGHSGESVYTPHTALNGPAKAAGIDVSTSALAECPARRTGLRLLIEPGQGRRLFRQR